MKISLNNLGTINANIVHIKTNSIELDVWFSYETPVAFVKNGVTVARQNDWSNTTGKLINQAEPDKLKRISGAEFEKQLANALGNL